MTDTSEITLVGDGSHLVGKYLEIRNKANQLTVALVESVSPTVTYPQNAIRATELDFSPVGVPGISIRFNSFFSEQLNTVSYITLEATDTIRLANIFYSHEETSRVRNSAAVEFPQPIAVYQRAILIERIGFAFLIPVLPLAVVFYFFPTLLWLGAVLFVSLTGIILTKIAEDNVHQYKTVKKNRTKYRTAIEFAKKHRTDPS
jgi:hypothetical protein